MSDGCPDESRGIVAYCRWIVGCGLVIGHWFANVENTAAGLHAHNDSTGAPCISADDGGPAGTEVSLPDDGSGGCAFIVIADDDRAVIAVVISANNGGIGVYSVVVIADG